MNISIKNKIVREFWVQYKESKDEKGKEIERLLYSITDYSLRKYLNDADETRDKNLDDKPLGIHLPNRSLSELRILQKLFSNNEGISTRTKNVLDQWIDSLDNPMNAKVTTLKNLEIMLIEVLKKEKRPWILGQNPDGNIVPYAVKEVKYLNRNRDDFQRVELRLTSNEIDRKSSWHDNDSDSENPKLNQNNKTIYFYQDEIVKNVIFDEDGEKSSKEMNLHEVLSNQGFFLPTKQLIENYEKELESSLSIQRGVGTMYKGVGKCLAIPDGKGSSFWREVNQEDNAISKLVVDSIKESSVSQTVRSENFGEIEVPTHPYVLLYNLTLYRYAVCHVNNIEKYEYDATIIDKLILAENKKKILKSLIYSENNFNDIVSGKSGGIIILSTGLPGVGKTLTAEVYSELIGKPLYSIQSSQLGISVDEIERNLNKALFRSDKWGTILLIDEADVYIHKRGQDIVQNCIVGTFLRLLEYYNGIMFLTSNRPEIVDDAIMSRVTIHVRYEMPTKDELSEIFKVLSESMSVEIDSEFYDQFVEKYKLISGRDVRNLLKDVKKCFPNEKLTISVLDEIAEFLPFLNKK